MPGLTMAINPKAPTARKNPVTSTPTPKVAAKTQQQRKTSVSQAVPKTQQQRKNLNAQNSPKVVVKQQRKTSAVKPTAMVDNKRKIKAENVSPTMADLQVKPVGAEKGTARPEARNESPPKKQKVEETMAEIMKDTTVMSPSEFKFTAPNTQFPSLPPSAATQSAQSTQMMTNLLRHVLQTQPTLLPPNLSLPITSPHIDAIAHSMWQIAFKHVVMLQRACQYSAMYAPVKLAALAKLNFLPSWWFFRDLVVGGLPGLVKGGDGKGGEKGGGKGGLVIDDREMMGVWDEAVRWCGGVVARREGVGRVVGREEEREGEEQEGGMVVQEEGLVLDSRMVDGSESGEGAE
ncbi:uncharacterized protein J4E87_010970 [Alternaria ethzedia]|uniref:uncharacterized protein n=1 Tax=Alternaria ethzedia TaxID=181014 RepID=UPI0020C1DC58|nr:uncharacterized protein J4E87_010970 [Alternaria ethzedia]KAI4609853.1 hypothetical protein J4E87_010970 [Alternaria ethzedia]